MRVADALGASGLDAREARLLLAEASGFSQASLIAYPERELPGEVAARFEDWARRRRDGEPVAYLVGHREFYGLDLAVNPAVLIPRPETEELVEHLLARLPPEARLADLGTGSGAIAIAVAVERSDAHVLATDVSRNALAVAAGNAQRHGVADRITFACGSWWDAVPAEAVFDAVVSNPPYIDPSAPVSLAADVAAFEPPLALFTAPGDPASCYRAIVAGLAARLRPGGWFVAETGLGASGPAERLLQDQPFLADVALLADAGNAPRFLVARRR